MFACRSALVFIAVSVSVCTVTSTVPADRTDRPSGLNNDLYSTSVLYVLVSVGHVSYVSIRRPYKYMCVVLYT